MTPADKHYVFLDPDGTFGGTYRRGWIAVIVEAPTGVIYANQCHGISTAVMSVEGFLVPLGGVKSDVDDEPQLIDPRELTDVFHGNTGDPCRDGGDAGCAQTGPGLPRKLRKVLANRVSEIPFWVNHPDDDSRTRRVPLELDLRREGEILEAWVPVLTPLGAGMLVWGNCD